jgi:PAS domain S-box-containing protein
MIRRPSLRETMTFALLGAAFAIMAWPMPEGVSRASGTALLALIAAPFFVEGLPLNFPDRAGVTLSALPLTLLWYYCGPAVAALAAAVSILTIALLHGRELPVVGAARAIVTVWVAHLLAHEGVAIAPAALRQAAGANLGVILFVVAFALVAPLLSLLAGDESPRPEPFSSLVMAPLAVILVNLTAERGMAMLPIFLLGTGAILLLVRSNVNVMTLHRQVSRLVRHGEVIAQELRVERDTSAAIVNYSGDGIFTVDRSLRIRHFNPALSALTGLREEGAVGRPAEEILGSQHAPSVVGDALRRALREGRAVRIESPLQTPEGVREITTSYTAIPGPNGNVELGIGVVRDVTEEKEQVRVREDFFSLITHDLRNPLTAIVGNTQLLERELERSLDERALAHRLVGRIEKANEQLLRLVNNLLELQRLESGRELLQPQPVALRPLLEDLAGEFRSAALERGLTVRLTGKDVPAWADPTWTREILANLFSNAIKYTPQGGTIDLLIEPRGGQVAVAVTDTGYGLVPEEQEKLFTKFFRSKRPEIRGAGGTGLGLALAKRMAERMGGDIQVRSTVGVGSTFTVVLPLGELPPFVGERERAAKPAEPAGSVRMS